jgi:hypothetical protein
MHHHSSLLRGIANFLPKLVSNHNPPDLHLLNSWDYRGMPSSLVKEVLLMPCLNIIALSLLLALNSMIA